MAKKIMPAKAAPIKRAVSKRVKAMPYDNHAHEVELNVWEFTIANSLTWRWQLFKKGLNGGPLLAGVWTPIIRTKTAQDLTIFAMGFRAGSEFVAQPESLPELPPPPTEVETPAATEELTPEWESKEVPVRVEELDGHYD